MNAHVDGEISFGACIDSIDDSTSIVRKTFTFVLRGSHKMAHGVGDAMERVIRLSACI